jgi:hypothetical protein
LRSTVKTSGSPKTCGSRLAAATEQRLVVCFERCRDEIGGGGRAVGQVEQRGGADQIVTRI